VAVAIDSSARPTIAEHRDGGRFEEAAGYVRAKRVGDLVFVAGTTAIEPSGRVDAPGDLYAQSRYAIERVADALVAVGSGLEDVVRVRAYLTDLDDAAGFARAHRELLGSVRPVLTAVGAGLATPGVVVEIEVDAVAGADVAEGSSDGD
jgi:enamine deaminase RidA (YjgF/YER057c/UK114 family)